MTSVRGVCGGISSGKQQCAAIPVRTPKRAGGKSAGEPFGNILPPGKQR